jgi:hypothetical protein
MQRILRRTTMGVGAVAMVLLSTSPVMCQRLSPPSGYGRVAPEASATGARAPKWSGSWLLHWKSLAKSDEPGENFSIYERDGRLAAKARIWFPEAWQVRIDDAAAAEKGQIAVVGTAFENSGAVAGFLALLSSGGRITKVVRTSPLQGQSVVFGPDDTIWVLGLEVGPGRRLATMPDHDTVQHYGADGRLLGGFLPYSTWGCPPLRHPALPYTTRALVASRDRVGILTSNCAQWVELDLKGQTIARGPLQFPASSDGKRQYLFGAVMTPDNQVYADFKTSSTAGLYRLIRETGTWQAVQGTLGEPDSTFRGLLGIEGDSLVCHGGRGQVFWAKVSE